MVHEITIRKANADRKLLDSKIEDIFENYLSRQLPLLTFYKRSKPIVRGKTPEEMENTIKSSWQQLNDLIRYRLILNDKVMMAYGGNIGDLNEDNLKVEVKYQFTSLDNFIEKPHYLTIAQAIARKGYFHKIIDYCERMLILVNNVISDYHKQTEINEKEIFSVLNSQFGPESTASAKQRLEYEQAIRPGYELVIINPLNIKDTITTAIEKMSWFVNEIDSLISNATETNTVSVDDSFEPKIV